jgi:hypothetical protein
VIQSSSVRWALTVARGRGGVHTGIWCGGLAEGDHFEELGVDGSIILEFILKKWNRSMCWIDLAQDRDRWLGLVNAGSFLTS